ncbi:hypothetical protein BH10PSE9_BH10PSE9_00520 [soil metagenome]
MITRRTVLTGVSALTAGSFLSPAFSQGNSETKSKGKKHQKNGKDLVGNKIKDNGNHHIDKADKIDVAVDVRDGKVVGLKAKHPQKGELQVGKVKSTEKFALLESGNLLLAQTTYIYYYAYWFQDEYGDYWYYWFPVEYIIDDGSWVVYSA